LKQYTPLVAALAGALHDAATIPRDNQSDIVIDGDGEAQLEKGTQLWENFSSSRLTQLADEARFLSFLS